MTPRRTLATLITLALAIAAPAVMGASPTAAEEQEVFDGTEVRDAWNDVSGNLAKHPDAQSIDLRRIRATQSDSAVIVVLHADEVHDTPTTKQAWCATVTNRSGETPQTWCYYKGHVSYGPQPVKVSIDAPCPRAPRFAKVSLSSLGDSVQFTIPLECFIGGSDWKATGYSYWTKGKKPARWPSDDLGGQYTPYFAWDDPNEPIDDLDCDHFEDSDSPFQDAMLFYVQDETDPHKLDGDGDGYPCEYLAADTPVFNWYWPEDGTDLAGQPMDEADGGGQERFRMTYWLTSRGDRTAIELAAYDVFAAQAAGPLGGPDPDEELPDHYNAKALLENLIGFINTEEQAQCIRPYLLAYVYDQDARDEYADTAQMLFGIAQLVLLRNPTVKLKDVDEFIFYYMSEGGSYASDMQKVASATSAKRWATEAFTCNA